MYKQLLLATPLVAASALAIYLIKKYKNTVIKHDTEPMYEAMFFNQTMCTHHSTKYEDCTVSGCFCNNLLKIKTYIKDAKSSLDICLFLITLEDVTAEIVRAHQRDVKIRVISDAHMSVTNGSKIDIFKKNGIDVRLRYSSFLMHHKFVIIDNHLLLTGSLNWTMQGVFGNWDSLAITSNSDLVDQFSEEFNWMWKSLEKEIMAVG